jgi:cysteine desulfurase
VAASAGAACHADQVEISHVLTAMGVPQAWAMGTLRFTTGRYTTAAEIDRALEVIVAAVKKLRG